MILQFYDFNLLTFFFFPHRRICLLIISVPGALAPLFAGCSVITHEAVPRTPPSAAALIYLLPNCPKSTLLRTIKQNRIPLNCSMF